MEDGQRQLRSVWITAAAGSLLILVGLSLLRLELKIHGTGVVAALHEELVYAPAAGVIAAHHVELGQMVQAGEVLLELDDHAEAARLIELDQRLVELAARRRLLDLRLRELDIKPAELDVITAPDRLRRLERIRDIQADIADAYQSGHTNRIVSTLDVSRQEIDRLQAELDALAATVQAGWRERGLPELEAERLRIERTQAEALESLARRERELVEARRAALRIVAPTNGQVVALHYDYPGMSVAQGAEVLKIAVLDGQYRVKAQVDERNIDLLRAGTPALMQSEVFDSMLEGHVRGEVYAVAPEGQPSEVETAGHDRSSYRVRILVKETPHPLVLGSRMKVQLLLGRRSLVATLLHSGHGRKTIETKP